LTLIGSASISVADAPSALGGHLERAFASELGFMLDAAILSGTGAGQPLGILNSAATITVAKQSGQSSGTIMANNIEQSMAVAGIAMPPASGLARE
jgi:HK97 family phage major capsid protein